MTLLELGAKVEVAPSHIFHIENGTKVPSQELAVRLARALGEDEDLYRAWARARSRSDFYTAVDSAAVLANYLRGSEAAMLVSTGREAVEADWARPRDSRVSDQEPVVSFLSMTSVTEGPGPARLLVPVFAEGEDPGSDPRPRGAFDTLRLDPRLLGSIELLDRPFAYPLSHRSTRRVEGILPARGIAVITRRFLPLRAHEVYAVRTGPGIVLTRTMWNGSELLLLPGPGENDFQTLPARTTAELERRIVGMVAVVRAEA